MKTLLTAIALAGATALAAGTPSVAALEQGDAQKYDKGSTVTLQGCVVAAEKKDTYVLTNVREWPASNTDQGKFGKRYYWLDKVSKDMKAHLGHTIQVTGKISDVSESEMEWKVGENGVGMNVEIEGPGRDVITPAANASVAVNPATVAHKDDIKITLLKLKVDELKMTSPTCSTTIQ